MTATGEAAEALRAIRGAPDCEWIEYHPLGGRPRRIQAVVDRGSPARLAAAPEGRTPAILVTVANDEHEGIASRDFDTGGDGVGLAVRVGGDLEERPVARLVSHDAGQLVLEIR